MLNPQAPTPLYHQLAEQLTARIRSGEYPPGSRIPSEHQLSADFAVGRPTVRQAIEVLARKGLLTRRRGAGTFVCEPQQEIALFSLDGTGAAFHDKGLAVESHPCHRPCPTNDRNRRSRQSLQQSNRLFPVPPCPGG